MSNAWWWLVLNAQGKALEASYAGHRLPTTWGWVHMSGVCRGILSLIGLFSHELVTNVIVVMLPKSSVKDTKAFYSLVNRMVYTGGNFSRSTLWFPRQICGTLIMASVAHRFYPGTRFSFFDWTWERRSTNGTIKQVIKVSIERCPPTVVDIIINCHITSRYSQTSASSSITLYLIYR